MEADNLGIANQKHWRGMWNQLFGLRARGAPEDARGAFANQPRDLNGNGNRDEQKASLRRRGLLTCSNSSSLGFALSFLLSSTAVWNLADVIFAGFGRI